MKKKNVKRLLAAACVAALAVSGAGCGKKEAKTVNTNSDVSNANEFPIVKEKVDMSVFAVKNPYITDFETNDFTKYYEEMTNVHINWNVAAGDEQQAFNLMLASGEYPDVIMGMQLSKSSQLNYAEQGILVDIAPYVEKYGYNLKKILKENNDISEGIYLGDAIYGLPTIQGNYRTTYYNQMWVYKPWLEKLGLEKPTTTEEFYQMLKAFKENDLNGNGKADEIPLIARGVYGDPGIEFFLMSAFIPDGENRLYVEDGKVKFTPVQPEFREGLRYIKKLYDEGLLYPDSFTIDRAQIMSIGENDPVILGAAPGMFPGMFTISNGNEERYYEYTAIAPLKGPKGVQASVKHKQNFLANFAVTSACKCPEIAVKWVDWMYSDDGRRISQSGIDAPVSRKAKDGELGFDGKQATWAKDKVENSEKNDAGMSQNRTWHNFGVWYSSPETLIHTCDYNDVLDKHGEWYKAYSASDKVGVDNFLTDLAIPAEDLDVYSDFQSALDQVDVSFASFIIGDLSIDDDWDSYVKELEDLGLKEYLKVVQKAYDSSKKN